MAHSKEDAAGENGVEGREEGRAHSDVRFSVTHAFRTTAYASHWFQKGMSAGRKCTGFFKANSQ